MIDLRSDFEERLKEVEAFIRLVSIVEHATRTGMPLVQGRTGDGASIDPLQQRLLYGSVYLHLYSLVESTISRCVAAVEEAASQEILQPWDLSIKLREEWVRSMARTHESLKEKNRLQSAIALCDHLIRMLPPKVAIDHEGGGNWDDELIHQVAKRLGVEFSIPAEIQAGVKRRYRDDLGALKTIKKLRNKLAHGEMTFSECGDGLTVDDLEKLTRTTVAYLREVIRCFVDFITRLEYLHPAKRQTGGAG